VSGCRFLHFSDQERVDDIISQCYLDDWYEHHMITVYYLLLSRALPMILPFRITRTTGLRSVKIRSAYNEQVRVVCKFALSLWVQRGWLLRMSLLPSLWRYWDNWLLNIGFRRQGRQLWSNQKGKVTEVSSGQLYIWWYQQSSLYITWWQQVSIVSSTQVILSSQAIRISSDWKEESPTPV
jgi:hypothetical protein